MSKASKALDGDWQGDGFGIAWLDGSDVWQVQKSLQPIWEEKASFTQVPVTKTLIAHARSASFPHHKGLIEFNQPYIIGDAVFVFNGLVKGVTIPNIPGKIGAEKICSLVREALQSFAPQEALEHVKRRLLDNSKEIVALNIGLATKDGIYSLNHFSRHPEYYSLHMWEQEGRRFICSEPLSF